MLLGNNKQNRKNLCAKIRDNAEPPVTSHIWVMADSSVGTLPSCSLSGVAAPGSLSTRAKRRWSQRKGSLVSSLPARGEFRGRCSWTTDKTLKRYPLCDWNCDVTKYCRRWDSTWLHYCMCFQYNVLTSSGTPELWVSLFPSVIVMITDGSRKKGLRPWGRNDHI